MVLKLHLKSSRPMAQLSVMNEAILGVDVGRARIGLALASTVAKLPRPYSVLENNDDIYRQIDDIAKEEQVSKIIIGIPRNMSGEETAQTREIRQFAEKLQQNTEAQLIFADESLSTRRAETMRKELKDRPREAPIDDLAACFILEEFLARGGDGKV